MKEQSNKELVLLASPIVGFVRILYSFYTYQNDISIVAYLHVDKLVNQMP